MKRYSLRDAFTGDPNPHMEGIAAMGTGPDAVEIQVKGGKLILIVSPDVRDDEVFDHELHKAAHGPWQVELELESGMRLTLWLPEGPTCADLRIKRSLSV